MTGPGTNSRQNILVRIMAPTYLLFFMSYPKPVSFTEFLMDYCNYDDIVGTILITDLKLLHFKLSKSGQTLILGKTSFPRSGHIIYQR